jgi:hypothetical protein
MASNQAVERLFNLYAENWKAVKSHPNLSVEPDVDDVFVCPMCFNYFPREALSEGWITLEHVPPKSLKSNIVTITCKRCNNWAGSQLDSQLLREQEFMEFLSGVDGASSEVTYSINGYEFNLPATSIRRNPNIWELIGDPKRTNPSHLQKVTKSLQAITNWNDVTFSIQVRGHKRRLPDAARLRIAYLLAFSALGYGFLLNPNLAAIRGQIQNPGMDILPTWGIVNKPFPDEFLGVNIVVEPKELQSYLVVFDLITKRNTTERYGVFLPGPGAPGLKIYRSLLETEGKPIALKVRYLSRRFDFTESPFESLDIWAELNDYNNSATIAST